MRILGRVITFAAVICAVTMDGSCKQLMDHQIQTADKHYSSTDMKIVP